jgi:hypothetical protein
MHFPDQIGGEYYETNFGMYHQRVADCFRLFLRFMIQNWSYLLTDNLEFLKPWIPACAEAIRVKCIEHSAHHTDGILTNAKLPAAPADGALLVFAGIDNTINAHCRPAGGPARDGTLAPRNDPLIQQAFWNGWKKLHGLSMFIP